jgi:lysophospholipase L1-like esterase
VILGYFRRASINLAHSFCLILSAILLLEPNIAYPKENGAICNGLLNNRLDSPLQRNDTHAIDRFNAINRQVRHFQKDIVFLGDSLTERWPESVWNKYFYPLRSLNAGVDGDRTEHLLWRIDHGNLDGNPPKIVVLLIGTNDLGHGRSAELTAEGIRTDAARISARLPASKILLLGLLPRSDRFGRDIYPVNRLIAACNGGMITYADVGRQLQSLAPKSLFIDGVHLTDLGYEELSKYLRVILLSLLGVQ